MIWVELQAVFSSLGVAVGFWCVGEVSIDRCVMFTPALLLLGIALALLLSARHGDVVVVEVGVLGPFRSTI